ncbi:MAG: sulfite exporter TauE/SafE family protein [Cyclobacteriaceae bacterium]|nr:sulfite exporter TauE/SafE family protein [Cyclobacteriaceae bacterium]MCH8514959.1 sulfite exporter TauE/SafE family protein [Cyclobacteriaceae bacterium]
MLISGFLLGFLGSFHCIGMCGPIALALSAGKEKAYYANRLLYNLGRSFTYAGIGFLFGWVGYGLQLAGVQQALSIAAGISILLMAVIYKKSEKMASILGLQSQVNHLKRALGRYIKRGGSFSYWMTGMLNGLLPCGMVYVAVIAALALPNPYYAALFMFIFGLGTTPALFAAMISGRLVSPNIRQKLFRLMPLAAAFIGVLFIIRGLNLNIPYLSPFLMMPDLSLGADPDLSDIPLCH